MVVESSNLGLAFTYSVKIINPKKQGGVQVIEWATDDKFTTVMAFRKQLEVNMWINPNLFNLVTLYLGTV